MSDVVLVSAVRTPIGKFGGVFSHLSAVELGVCAVRGAIEEAGIPAELVEEVILGNVLFAGLGQNVARQVALASNIPDESSAFTVSKVCGSGLKAIILGAQAIALGDAKVIVAGGAESMSNAAYAIPSARWGLRMGNGVMIDTLTHDGFTDAFDGKHVGLTAEYLAARYFISRAELDQWAASSQQRAEQAQNENRFADEIIPVEIKSGRDGEICFSDEFPRHGTTEESLAKLKPVFSPDGVITAGNASGVNDGAAALVLMSRTKARELGLRPLASIKSWATAGVSPKVMGYGPVPASNIALDKAGLTAADLDLVEVNEAFAAQSISVIRGLGIKSEITNVNGGAIALGHPIGASGARILVTLLHELRKRSGRYGLATLCVGGGMGVSLVVEREN